MEISSVCQSEKRVKTLSKSLSSRYNLLKSYMYKRWRNFWLVNCDLKCPVKLESSEQIMTYFFECSDQFLIVIDRITQFYQARIKTAKQKWISWSLYWLFLRHEIIIFLSIKDSFNLTFRLKRHNQLLKKYVNRIWKWLFERENIFSNIFSRSKSNF